MEGGEAKATPRRRLRAVDSRLEQLSLLVDLHAASSDARAPQLTQEAPATPRRPPRDAPAAPAPAPDEALAPAPSGAKRKKGLQVMVDFAPALEPAAATGGSDQNSKGSKKLLSASSTSAATPSTPFSARSTAVTTALASPSPMRDPLAALATPRSARARLGRLLRGKYREKPLSPVDERLKAFENGFNEIRELMRAADLWQFTEQETLRPGQAAVGSVSDRGYRYYRFEVPPGAARVVVRCRALAGDPDLFASFQTDCPNREHHQFRSVREGDDRIEVTDESPEFRAAHPFYIAVFGHGPSEYAITAVAACTSVLPVPGEVSGRCGPGAPAYYRLEVADAKQSLVLSVEPASLGGGKHQHQQQQHQQPRGPAPGLCASRDHRFPSLSGKHDWGREGGDHVRGGGVQLSLDPVDRRFGPGWLYVAVESPRDSDFKLSARLQKYPPDASADRALSRAVVAAIARGRYAEAASIAALDPERFPALAELPISSNAKPAPRVPPLALPLVPGARPAPAPSTIPEDYATPLRRPRPPAEVLSAGPTARGPRRFSQPPSTRRTAPAGSPAAFEPSPPREPRRRRRRELELEAVPPSPMAPGGMLVVLDSDRGAPGPERGSLPWESAVLPKEPASSRRAEPTAFFGADAPPRRAPAPVPMAAVLERIEARYGGRSRGRPPGSSSERGGTYTRPAPFVAAA
eukprot:tig00000113_g5587.t1